MSLVAQDSIKANYKSRGLLATVLNGYLSLRKLVVQRTKLIDETQDKMLELLEDMTSGRRGGDGVGEGWHGILFELSVL